jgi:hypothetical protein
MVKLTITLLLVSLLLFHGPTSFAGGLGLDLTRLKKSKVRYTRHEALEVFPTPVLAIKRGGLASGAQEIEEIKERIVYPLIIESADPIASIVVEFFPETREEIGVTVYWSNGAVHESLIGKNPQGHYDTDAYEVFFKKPTP